MKKLVPALVLLFSVSFFSSCMSGRGCSGKGSWYNNRNVQVEPETKFKFEETVELSIVEEEIAD